MPADCQPPNTTELRNFIEQRFESGKITIVAKVNVLTKIIISADNLCPVSERQVQRCIPSLQLPNAQSVNLNIKWASAVLQEQSVEVVTVVPGPMCHVAWHVWTELERNRTIFIRSCRHNSQCSLDLACNSSQADRSPATLVRGD